MSVWFQRARISGPARGGVGARISGPARGGVGAEVGMVTLEAALASVSLITVVALLLGVFVVVAAQLRVNDAARVAARAAASASDLDARATELAQRSAPGSSVTISRDGSTVDVSVRQSVRVPIAGIPPFTVSSHAVVLDEVTAAQLSIDSLGGG